MMQLNRFKVGINQPLFLIAGPCVIESEALVMEIAGPFTRNDHAFANSFYF